MKKLLFLILLGIQFQAQSQSIAICNSIDPYQRPCLPYWRDLMLETLDSIHVMNCLLAGIPVTFPDPPSGSGIPGVCSPFDPHYRPCNPYWDDLNYALNDSIANTNAILRAGGGGGGGGNISGSTQKGNVPVGNGAAALTPSTGIYDSLHVVTLTDTVRIPKMPNVSLTGDSITFVGQALGTLRKGAPYTGGTGIGVISPGNVIYADSTIVVFTRGGQTIAGSKSFTGACVFSNTVNFTGVGPTVFFNAANGVNIKLNTSLAYFLGIGNSFGSGYLGYGTTTGGETMSLTWGTGIVAIREKMTIMSTSATYNSGTGSPEGVVTATIGSIFTRTDGGAGTTLYVKESGSGNTGWVGK